MGKDERKCLVPDVSKSPTQAPSVGSTTRPPSRRNDEDDRPPPAASSPRPPQARNVQDGPAFYPDNESPADGSTVKDTKVPSKRLKQTGPQFSPDDEAGRKVIASTKEPKSAKGDGARRMHRNDKDNRPPSSMDPQVRASRIVKDGPAFYPNNASSTTDGKIKSKNDYDSLKETGPEFSPDCGTTRKVTRRSRTKGTTAKGGAIQSRWKGGDEDDRPSSPAARHAKRGIEGDGPSFYTDDSKCVDDQMEGSSTLSKVAGPEFSPDNSAVRVKSKRKKHRTQKGRAGETSQANAAETAESGAKHPFPANVASLVAEKDGDHIAYAKASGRGERATTPGATAVSSSKHPGKNLKGSESDQPEVYPDDSVICNDRKKAAKSSKKKSKSAEDIGSDVVPEPVTPSAYMPSAEESTPTPANGSATTIRPRPPRDETVIGAVAVDGIDGPSGHDDDYYNDDQVSEAVPDATEGASSLPVARMADESNQDDYLGDLGQAEPLSPDDLKGQGIRGWIRHHKTLSAIAVIVLVGAIVGGAVGATQGGGASAPAPTLEPTLAPTSAPTLSGFEEIVDALSTITPYSVLTDPSTPQNAAVTWLLREDEYGIDLSDAPKLLQRYALATIYFATGGRNWTNQLQFLTNQDDCLWNELIGTISFGLWECNDQGLATKIQLCKCLP